MIDSATTCHLNAIDDGVSQLVGQREFLDSLSDVFVDVIRDPFDQFFGTVTLQLLDLDMASCRSNVKVGLVAAVGISFLVGDLVVVAVVVQIALSVILVDDPFSLAALHVLYGPLQLFYGLFELVDPTIQVLPDIVQLATCVHRSSVRRVWKSSSSRDFSCPACSAALVLAMSTDMFSK
ncbi:hypothetical protein B0H66DRAFT_631809 [Apodospora peruviana]|uniref:Uncharacterized protein n=1 Tax=Apodospora peruviana TaxID=516989 RepID=A0AAE0HU32_9PEZI|nr:hypothetical protein B0H66DRAFT_631809 [Apodospora peruviana]